MKKPGSERIGARRNRGSAIITVVVAMLFVVAIGTSLLFAAYTGYRVTLTERGDKKNFYSAAAAMDEIRAGLQTAVSDAIDTAYTKTLTTYAAENVPGSTKDWQAEFANNFYISLAYTKLFDPETGKHLWLFDSGPQWDGSNPSAPKPSNPLSAEPMWAYFVETFQKFVSSSDSVKIVASKDNVVGKAIDKKKDDKNRYKSFTLKDITVIYTQNGYESNVTSDIVITVPDFFLKPVLSTDISNCAIVAEQGLTADSQGMPKIVGDVYAGNVAVSNSAQLTLSGGNLFCKGTNTEENAEDGLISVKDGATFNFDAPNNELWARNIKLGSATEKTNGIATLNGRLNVANDVVLDGKDPTDNKKGSSVILKGSYFGFGSDAKNSGKSSAIIANSRNSTVDISGLDKLFLAGVSFIDITESKLNENVNNSTTPYNNAIPMGESLTVKSNQLAYLVPTECITNYPSNPCMFNAGNKVEAPNVNPSVEIWKDKETNTAKRLSDYIGNGKGSVKALYKNMGAADTDPKLAYVFLLFNKQEYANEYFRDYFTAHPERIEEYLKLYATISDKKADANINAKGNVFYTDTKGTTSVADDKLALFEANGTEWANNAGEQFKAFASPFKSFVNQEKLNEISKQTLEFKLDGNTVAVVTGDKYTYGSAQPNNIKLIIAKGNVTIDKDFSGIVLSEGVVTTKANITAATLDGGMLKASCGPYKLADFVGAELATGEMSDGWDLGRLVTYKNWSKH